MRRRTVLLLTALLLSCVHDETWKGSYRYCRVKCERRSRGPGMGWGGPTFGDDRFQQCMYDCRRPLRNQRKIRNGGEAP
jgi:hypothetical protein